MRYQGGGLVEVHLNPVLHSFGLIVVTLVKFRTVKIAHLISFGRIRLLIKNMTILSTCPATAQAFDQDIFVSSHKGHNIHMSAKLLEHRLQRLCLGWSAGKAI